MPAPISGFEASGLSTLKFLILPVVIGIVGGIGSGTRWYRTIALEEVGKDYVRTARAKGLPERQVFSRYVLRNSLIPVLTGAVVVLPIFNSPSALGANPAPGSGSPLVSSTGSRSTAAPSRRHLPRLSVLRSTPSRSRPSSGRD